MSASTLVEIPLESLPILRDSYQTCWPEYILAFNFLDKMINRFKDQPEQREMTRIFSIDGKVENDATFIAVTNNREIVVGTMDLTFQTLFAGLKYLNFNTKKIFVCCRKIHHNPLLNFIHSSNLKVLFDEEAVMIHMKREDALSLQYEIPKGLLIKSLKTRDAERINSVWPRRSPGSVEFIRHCIASNISVGLYNESTGELLAWCLEQDAGFLSVLQVDESHLRKGYATLVVKAITKKFAEERGLDVITNVMHENKISMDLFKKLGFREIDETFRIGVIQGLWTST